MLLLSSQLMTVAEAAFRFLSPGIVYSARRSFRVHVSHTEKVTANTEVECAPQIGTSKRGREKLAVR